MSLARFLSETVTRANFCRFDRCLCAGVVSIEQNFLWRITRESSLVSETKSFQASAYIFFEELGVLLKFSLREYLFPQLTIFQESRSSCSRGSCPLSSEFCRWFCRRISSFSIKRQIMIPSLTPCKNSSEYGITTLFVKKGSTLHQMILELYLDLRSCAVLFAPLNFRSLWLTLLRVV